ncbi:hypothetical protein TrRE_jg5866, partial [Triparma retinervis]
MTSQNASTTASPTGSNEAVKGDLLGFASWEVLKEYLDHLAVSESVHLVLLNGSVVYSSPCALGSPPGQVPSSPSSKKV